MPIVHTSQLADYIATIGANGGQYDHPNVKSRFHPLELAFDTVVDQSISPFSDEYFDQQVALYREIAGRDLNQATGELHVIDVRPLETAPNPLGIRDVATAIEHVRPLATMLSLANLKGPARILDMGAGHGFSSEIFAMAGCRVDAVDIDPLLSALSRTRAAARNLAITRIESDFEDLSMIETGVYDAAFFFQSLHHCLRPWNLIAKLRTKLKPGGVIGFAGEPMQSIWWRNWGLRLDGESLFAARGMGWFESGWSAAFITECFTRNGMQLNVYASGSHGGVIGIASDSVDKLADVDAVAERLEVPRRHGDNQLDFSERDFMSLAGDKARAFGRPAFRQRPGTAGVLVYGPYVTLDPGTYEFAMVANTNFGKAGSVRVDVVSNAGTTEHFLANYAVPADPEAVFITGRFTLSEHAVRVEIRAMVDADLQLLVTHPSIRRLD